MFPTAAGYMIFRGSNSEKNAFRQNPEYAEKKRMFCEYEHKIYTYLVLHYRCCVT